MDTPKVLKVRNWDKWQSYRKGRGQPSWIKIHRRVMRNPDWVALSDAQRGQLVAIWLLAADQGGTIPASSKIIQKLCHMDSEPDINLLISAGFLERHPDDSQVDANCQPPDSQLTDTCPQNGALEEKRIEENRIEEEVPDRSDLGRSGKVYAYENGRIKLTTDDFFRWEKAFKNINLMAELESMAEWAAEQKNWFMALSAALAKKDAAALDRKARIQAEVGAGAKRVPTGGGYA